MKHLFSIYLFFLLFGCGSSTKEPKKDIINTDNNPPEKVEPAIIEDSPPTVPAGAVTANFVNNSVPFYAHVKQVDRAKGETTIDFENASIPSIIIPKTYGATLSTLRFDEFDRDLLLVTSRLKDPQFNKYYLFIYKGNRWQKVVNGFSIHRSHVTDSLVPIQVDKENTSNMFRYYSVFDLDETSELGYTWRLFSESIPIRVK